MRVTVAVARVGRGDALTVERFSDGSATVAVLDGWEAGGETGLGASFTAAGAEGRLGGGVRYQAGRAWTFGSVAAAEAFAERIAEHEDLLGEIRGALPFGPDRPRLPAPDATYREGGTVADLVLTGTLPIGDAEVDAELSGATVLGRRTEGEATTWSARLSVEALAHLGIVGAALGAESTREAVLEYTTEGGRPRAVSIRASAGLAGELQIFGQRTDMRLLAGSLRAATARGAAGGAAGTVADVELGLDLGDPANLAAVQGVLRPGRGWIGALRRLGARLDAAGELDLAIHRTTTERERAGGGVRVGAGVGADLARTTRTRELLQAWSVRGRGPLRERGDCASTPPVTSPR